MTYSRVREEANRDQDFHNQVAEDYRQEQAAIQAQQMIDDAPLFTPDDTEQVQDKEKPERVNRNRIRRTLHNLV